MAHSRYSAVRHFFAVLLILVLSITIGLLFDGILTFTERHTHPKKYEETVTRYATEYSIPKSIVFAVIKCESDFNPAAVSSAGAIGLMQMMPDTYEWLCKKTGDLCIPAMLYDPETNIRYGTYLLSFLYTRYGNWDTALAAYNAGLGNVDQWLEDPAYAGENGTLKEIPYKETRNYIKRVNEARRLYESLYPEAETSLGLRYKKI